MTSGSFRGMANGMDELYLADMSNAASWTLDFDSVDHGNFEFLPRL